MLRTGSGRTLHHPQEGGAGPAEWLWRSVTASTSAWTREATRWRDAGYFRPAGLLASNLNETFSLVR